VRTWASIPSIANEGKLIALCARGRRSRAAGDAADAMAAKPSCRRATADPAGLMSTDRRTRIVECGREQLPDLLYHSNTFCPMLSLSAHALSLCSLPCDSCSSGDLTRGVRLRHPPRAQPGRSHHGTPTAIRWSRLFRSSRAAGEDRPALEEINRACRPTLRKRDQPLQRLGGRRRVPLSEDPAVMQLAARIMSFRRLWDEHQSFGGPLGSPAPQTGTAAETVAAC